MNVLLPRTLFVSAILLAAGSASFAGTVTIESTKVFYEIGETIEFTITNGLDESISMNSFPYWWIIHVASGANVGPCVGLPVIHSIGPGQFETHTNGQIDCWTGDPFAPGLYWVGISYWTESDPLTTHDVSDPFCVGFDCVATPVDEGVGAGSWGRVKSLYR